MLDSNLTHRITRVANVKGSTVVEIGPGPGGLTRSLLMRGADRVIAIEKDPDCIAALQDLCKIYPNRLVLIEQDALKLNLSNLKLPPYLIVGNLPYNISTALLIYWLQEIRSINQMTLMFQKEVADRLKAIPSTKEYGRLSVMTQWLCNVKPEFNVGRQAFTPPTKVDSTLVTLVPRAKPLANASWNSLERVTAAAFNQRRKMLKSSLKGFKFNFSDLDINPNLRAEDLTVEEFCKLACSSQNS